MAAGNGSVSLSKVIEGLNLKMAYLPENVEEIKVTSRNVNRVGLCLVGFFDSFEHGGIYLFGSEEMHYLLDRKSDNRLDILDRFFSRRPPLVIITDNCGGVDEIDSCARKHKVSYAFAEESASVVMVEAIKFLGISLAPRTSLHGELVVIYGEGVLLTGESGVGKSETVIELIRRGHHLVADDVVDVRKISHEVLTGSAPSNIRYFVELRGIGIVNAEKMFGTDAVRVSSQIDLVVEMTDVEDRSICAGMVGSEFTTNILGIDLPIVKIPVKNGRNMTTLVEAATLATKQKKAGYNAGQDLLRTLRKFRG
ncbi:MAG: HPr(Ser) kinase/phosphatase [Oscillospiraceae bacterium]|jgi:HPr kinase/phosphorylase|nr:HPr(Ser) kinase/phosphatase [Oscillospiraceae bacterium]